MADITYCSATPTCKVTSCMRHKAGVTRVGEYDNERPVRPNISWMDFSINGCKYYDPIETQPVPDCGP